MRLMHCCFLFDKIRDYHADDDINSNSTCSLCSISVASLSELQQSCNRAYSSDYRGDDSDSNCTSISFMPAVTSTSGRHDHLQTCQHQSAALQHHSASLLMIVTPISNSISFMLEETLAPLAAYTASV